MTTRKPTPDDTIELPSTYAPADDAAAPASFTDLVAASRSEAVVSGAALSGDAYTRLTTEGKRQLVGVMFFIEKFEFNDGANGEYAIVRVVTERNERYSFTDGGSGIVPALLKAPAGRKIFCRHGLRASDYEFTITDPLTGDPKLDAKGKPITKAATTYYLT